MVCVAAERGRRISIRVALYRALLLLFGRSQSVYDSLGIGVMRLIAFAYQYHYLNWFSKTSIIKWHEVTRARAATILRVGWLAD